MVLLRMATNTVSACAADVGFRIIDAIPRRHTSRLAPPSSVSTQIHVVIPATMVSKDTAKKRGAPQQACARVLQHDRHPKTDAELYDTRRRCCCLVAYPDLIKIVLSKTGQAERQVRRPNRTPVAAWWATPRARPCRARGTKPHPGHAGRSQPSKDQTKRGRPGEVEVIPIR